MLGEGGLCVEAVTNINEYDSIELERRPFGNSVTGPERATVVCGVAMELNWTAYHNASGLDVHRIRTEY